MIAIRAKPDSNPHKKSCSSEQLFIVLTKGILLFHQLYRFYRSSAVFQAQQV
jgi:hypothetical protein